LILIAKQIKPLYSRGFILYNGRMNALHDIKTTNAEEFLAVIEIPKNSKMKYEIHKETGMLFLDRVFSCSMRYPANYGFIPQTLCEDGDALDVLVLGQEEIPPMTLVKCAPIGMIEMIDNGERDEKIIAVPIYKGSYFGQFKDIKEIPDSQQILIKEMEHFLSRYKDLEKDNKIVVKPATGRASAIKIIKESMVLYKKSK